MIKKIDFNSFNSKFNLHLKCSSENKSRVVYENFYLDEVVKELGGKVFSDGLLVIYDDRDISLYTKMIENAFPKTKGIIHCFGRDWLNRQLAVRKIEPFDVVLCDVSFDEILMTEDNLNNFFSAGVVEYGQDLFSEDYFKRWLEKPKNILKCRQSVSYKIPPCLGGKDDIDNLEIADSEVDLEMNMQIRNNQ